jgi:hypothetical protein
MNKQEAHERVEKSKEDSNILVAEFPREMRCEMCKEIKRYLFVFVETGISMEVCGKCYGICERLMAHALAEYRNEI